MNSAYDEQSAYEPPRRAYMAQRQPQESVGYNSAYRDTGDDHYDQPQQAYRDGGYEYDHEQYSSRGQHQYRNDGYGADDYGRQQYSGQYHQQREERAYDSRYQQRAPRAPPRQQQLASRPLPTQRDPPPPRDGRQPYAQDTPSSARGRGQSQRQDEQYEGRRGHFDVPRKPVTSSMDDWKAREKAKMKQETASPEVLPYDNAFPVFGKNKNSREGAQTSDSSQGRDRGHPRPRTAGDAQVAPGHGKYYPSRGDQNMPLSRPDLDRQNSLPEYAGATESGPSYERYNNSHNYAPQQTHPPMDTLATPVREEYPDQWPMIAGQTPPKVPRQNQSPPRRLNGPGSYNTPSALDEMSQRGYDQYAVPQQRRQPKPQGPPPIDTNQAYQSSHPGHANHQPLSPAHLPIRPATSQGEVRKGGQPGLNSSVQHPQSAGLHNSHDYAQKPWMQAQHTKQGSLDDIYGDYAGEDVPPKPLARAPTTREEEIEAEMPDFDSAAPAQVSSPQNRLRSNEDTRAIPPLMRTQTAPPSQMTQPQPRTDLGYDTSQIQQSYSAQEMRHDPRMPPQSASRRGRTPGPGGPPRRGMTAGGYEMGGMNAGGQERQYGILPANIGSHGPQHEDSVSSPAYQRPYANEPAVHRSLDETRQMSHHQGPPQQQRFYQSRPSAGRGYVDQQSSFGSTVDRPGFPEGPQDRSGSAPPQQGPWAGQSMPSNGEIPSQNSVVHERRSNPDALPHHPVPVRPGHMIPESSQSARPPPIRQHGDAAPPRNGQPDQKPPSADPFAQPVTHAELERLRSNVQNTGSPRQELILVKKLVEAASVLANESGRVDAKTAAKNRERFMNEAYKRLKRIVGLGYPDAQFYMADCHGQGTMGLEVDTKEAFKLYQAAAKAGHAQAAYRTAVCCEIGPEAGGGTSKDYPKAVQWYRRAATLGDGAAMYKLGAILLKGLLGQPRNIVEAVNWLKRGAEKADKENPHALHELAMLYESSNTNPEIRNKVVADNGYARELYQQAAQLGYKFSQFRLGQAYEYGNLGFSIDNRSSIAYYTKAAAQGDHQAELALSGWYLTGAEGILEHSDTEAYLWARKAASSEPPLAKAMFAMGYFTENGIGCPASEAEARKWYGRAASYKFPKAVERLEELRRSGGKAGSKGGTKPPPMNGKLTRKDQKKDEENCVMM